MEGRSKWSELQIELRPWKPERVAYALNPSTLEDGAGKSLSFRLPGLHNEINNNNKKNQKPEFSGRSCSVVQSSPSKRKAPESISSTAEEIS